jgi:hypothetical protein
MFFPKIQGEANFCGDKILTESDEFCGLRQITVS